MLDSAFTSHPLQTVNDALATVWNENTKTVYSFLLVGNKPNIAFSAITGISDQTWSGSEGTVECRSEKPDTVTC